MTKAQGHYIANVRDLEFNLFEVLRLGEVLDGGGYGELDTDTARTMLDEVCRLAEGPIAASFADADRNPPVFDPAEHCIVVSDEIKPHRADGQGRRMVAGRDRRGDRRGPRSRRR